ncbi:MAG: potassium channel family protein [Dehalococcoidia bacterium]
MNIDQRARALETVERATELPMLFLALLLVPLLVLPLFVTIPDEWDSAWQTADWIIWAAFAAELSVKTYLAPRRLRYLRDHWFDVLIVVVPIFRPLRVGRVLRLLRLLPLLGLSARVWYATRAIVGRHGLPYTLLVGLMLILAATVAITYVEHDSGGTIDNFGTALWWAVTTATTVGYGDTSPVTPEGRGIAVFVMIVGITLFGLVTANAAAFFVEAQEDKGFKQLEEIAARLQRLEEQIAQLRAELAPNANGAAPSSEPEHIAQRST